jgi:hypothetical protein
MSRIQNVACRVIFAAILASWLFPAPLPAADLMVVLATR